MAIRGSWADRLKSGFRRNIRTEGKRLYELGAVTRLEVTEATLRAHVDDEDTDEVFIEVRDKGVAADCDCRFWHHGVPCPHMWAVILAADAQEKTKLEAASAKEKVMRLPLQVPVSPEESAVKADPVPGSLVPSWYPLLFPSPSGLGGGYHSGSSECLIRYELRIDAQTVSIRITKHRRLKSGALSKPNRIGKEVLSDLRLSARDRNILELMLGAALKAEFCRRGYTYGVDFRLFEYFRPDSSTLGMLLPMLAETGLCLFFMKGDDMGVRLRPGSEARVSWSGECGKGARKADVVCRAVLRVHDSVIDLADVSAFFNTTPIMFVHQGAVHTLPGVNYEWVLSVRRHKGVVRVPKANVPEMLQAVFEYPDAPEMRLPESMMPARRESVDVRPCLDLVAEHSGITAQVWFDYGGQEVAWEDPRQKLLDTDAWVVTERDYAREQSLVAPLEDLGIDMTGEQPVAAEVLWKAVDALVVQGWTVRGKDKRRIHAGRLGALRVSSGMDWFELEGDVDFDGVAVPLPMVVRAYLRGEHVVELGNGETGILPRHWLEQHARLLDMGETGRRQDGVLRFHSAHAQLLDSLLDECPDQPRDFVAMRQKFKSFYGVTLPAPPTGLTGALRPYQREALGWFDFLAEFGFGGILADDMGLGKTVQALAWLLLFKERGGTGPSLVVGPTSLMFNWRDEAARFAPDLRVLTYTGQGRAGLEEQFQEHDLVLTTYGLLRRDVEVLRAVEWTCLILDESQAIKNPDSQTAKAARVLRSGHRLCLSGTPLENRLGELWSQMQFLNPGLLGSRKGFETRFTRPLAQGDAQARDLLQRSIRPFMLRRTKEAVAGDLPDKQETIVRCAMTDGQARIYERLHMHYRSEILSAVNEKGLEHAQMKVLEGLLRLRQVACHPALVGEKAADSGKLAELVRMVGDVVAEGHKALVFSQFTRFLEVIRKALNDAGIAHEYLDGRTPPRTREKRVASFQGPDGPPVFCISLKAGGVGLNLTAADYVFIMDPWWNPAVEAQAVNRAHRIGQDKNVFAYRLISRDSIDEKVLALQQEKKDLADTLLDGATTSIGALTREDLERLLA